MSANKRKRNNSIRQLLQQQQMATADQQLTATAVAAAAAAAKDKRCSSYLTSSDNGAAEMLEMPRVCRCCCKGDIELLSLFEASDETTTTNTTTSNTTQTTHRLQLQSMSLRQRRTSTTTASDTAAQQQKQQQQQQQQQQKQQRKSDNPVEYALSGAHSSMDTVREEMIVWMLDITRDDALPQEICRQCTAQFIMVAKFRRRCVRVQQRLQGYAQDIAERITRLTAKRQEQPVEDYMHLPESQLERKRRQVLNNEPPKEALQPKETKTEAELELEAPPAKLRRFQLRVRKMRLSSFPTDQVDSRTRCDSEQREDETETTQHKPGYNKLCVPWKTKAARKQLSDNWSTESAGTISPEPSARPESATPSISADAEEAIESSSTSPDQTSSERLSNLSVDSCRGFESDGNCTIGFFSNRCSTSPASFPPKRSPSRSPKALLRRGRRSRLTPNYAPQKRTRRILKSPIDDQADVSNSSSTSYKCLQTTELPESTVRETIHSYETKPSTAEEAPASTTAEALASRAEEAPASTTEEAPASTPAEDRTTSTLSSETNNDQSANNGKATPSESEVQHTQAAEQKESKETTLTDVCAKLPNDFRTTTINSSIEKPSNEVLEDVDAAIETAASKTNQTPVQFEELTSSTEHRESKTPEVPPAECEVEVEVSLANEEQQLEQRTELIVSIPLEVLSVELQRKLRNNDAAMESDDSSSEPSESEEELKEPVDGDDLNNNANVENFCQSATADSFNTAVALANKHIEAEPNGGKQPTKQANYDNDNDNELESLQTLAVLPADEAEVNELQLTRTTNSMDFLAEFERHCEKTLKLQMTTQQAPLELQLEVAKQQLEVEMNDVESTLHGILNEMQDQHLYTPVCTPIDEFLTPADYAPLNEPEATVPAASNLYENETQQQQLVQLQQQQLEQMQQQQLVQQQQHQQPQQQLKVGNLFDSSNFSNELIGFQNDMPCFENIEAAPESAAAQQSLQLELTQLLNEMQPAQQQQQLQLQQQSQQETVSYETLYQSTPTTATTAMPLTATSNNNKLQLIQMQPQETLWQAQPQSTHLQWSTVGNLESIKTSTPVASLDTLDGGSTTTTYYINASDIYQANATGSSYAVLDSNENYVLEQQQQTQQQQQQQPIMILIQQPELQQPVASASNPQQAPLHITYGPPLSNELHAYQQQQLTQQQQLQQQQNTQQQQLTQQQQDTQQQHQDTQQQQLIQQQHTQQLQLTQQPQLTQQQHPPQQRQQQQLTQLQHTQPKQTQQQLTQQQKPPQPQQQQQQQKVQNTVLGLKGAVPPPTRGRPPMLKCRFCQNGPRFSNSFEYSRHIIELHPAVAPFNCPHCPLSFAGRSKRNQHILSHHVVQQFHCGQCSQMFPAQRALDLHLQRFHMPLATEPAKGTAAAVGVRLDEVQLQMANNEQQAASNMPVLELQTSPSQPRRTRILCCPDCEDCTSATGHAHGNEQRSEELSNLQAPPMLLTPASLASPSPQPQAPHLTLPSPEQSEPDSTTATLRQFRKRCMASGISTPTTNTMMLTTASPSPSSSPSSSTMETGATTLELGKLRGSHQCVVCDKRFTNVIALRKHQQLAHDSQTTMPWVCSICKRGYRKRTDMDNHMKSHEPKGRPYECNECWVRFPEFKQLAMHKFTVHELIKPHTCDECGKQFGTESALKTHIKFHGERGFECEECNEMFPYIKDFRKHRRTHNRELFYKCEHCPRTFLHFTSFRAHMNTHLPLGVFLNDKITSPMPSSVSIAENPPTPASNDELMPLTPLSNCGNGNNSTSDDCPGSVEMMVESSVAPSLEMIVDLP